MVRSISFKLWLTIATALVLSLGTLLALTHYSLRQRILSLSFHALEEQLPALESNVVDVFEQYESLEPFTDDPRLWRRAINRSLPFSRRDLNLRPALSIPPPRPIDIARRGRDIHASQRQLLRSLSLFDAEKKLIVGVVNPSAQRHWYPVNYNRQVIGYISFEKPKYVLRRSEEIFLNEQMRSFVVLSIAMLFFAMLLATFISRWFVKPLKQLSRHMRAVAQGNLSARVRYEATDELGELCSNVNEMSEKLEANEVARKQWVADISHEMRTPLSVIKAQIESIQDGIRPASKENIALLSDQANALNHLINDLFELALSDVGALKLELTAVPINALIRNFIEDNRERCSSLGFIIELQDQTDSEPFVYADPNRLQQVFNNVLENSLRYTDTPGQFVWTIRSEKNVVYIQMEDSSPGVEEAFLETIFSRLYRVEKSRNRASGGAGLGLSLCQNLIHAHGGNILAKSSMLGGLKIEITLKAVEKYTNAESTYR